LFCGFWKMQEHGKNSLDNWAFNSGLNTGTTVSRQSLNERLNEKAVALGQSVLMKALNLKEQPKSRKISEKLIQKLAYFARVLIRDSTVQQVSNNLTTAFPKSNSTYSHSSFVQFYGFKMGRFSNWSIYR
jgi:hypothetical protein